MNDTPITGFWLCLNCGWTAYSYRCCRTNKYDASGKWSTWAKPRQRILRAMRSR